MIRYKHNFVVRGELWFDADSSERVDVLEYMHRSAPVPGCRSVEFLTIIIDLTKTEEALFAGIKPEVRRQIRRASESGDLVYECISAPQPAHIAEFLTSYKELAASKQLPPLNEKILEAYRANGNLTLSEMSTREGLTLSRHAYHVAPGCAAQLHSIAHFRADGVAKNLVGRAHRLHTWNDIQRFRICGLSAFDFGGFYGGTADPELLRVNAFKEDFGGTIARTYLCERGVTLRGKIYLALRNMARAGPLNSVAAMARVPAQDGATVPR